MRHAERGREAVSLGLEGWVGTFSEDKGDSRPRGQCVKGRGACQDRTSLANVKMVDEIIQEHPAAPRESEPSTEFTTPPQGQLRRGTWESHPHQGSGCPCTTTQVASDVNTIETFKKEDLICQPSWGLSTGVKGERAVSRC